MLLFKGEKPSKIGTNQFTLFGPDNDAFVIAGSAIYLKAGTVLDAATKASYSVTISVADPSLPGSTPVTTDYTLTIV